TRLGEGDTARGSGTGRRRRRLHRDRGLDRPVTRPRRPAKRSERREDWWVTGRRAVAEAIRAGLAMEVLVGTWVRATPALRDVAGSAAEGGVAVREVPRSTLDGIDPDHHGVAARIRRPRELGDAFLAEYQFVEDDVVVVLDGITDPHNLGAAARAAEAAGATSPGPRV